MSIEGSVWPTDYFPQEGNGGTWVFRVGGYGEDEATAIATDDTGQIYLAGEFEDAVDFDPGPLIIELYSEGLSDGFLARYSSEGALQWVRAVARGTGKGIVDDVAPAADGSVYVAGRFSGIAWFESIELTSTGKSGELDGFVAKYLPDGTLSWVRQISVGGAADSAACRIAVAGNSEIYVTGYFREWAMSGPQLLLSSGGADTYVAKLNADDGQILWAVRAGGPGDDIPRGLVADPNGSLYLAGVFADSAIFGSHAISSAGQTDAFVARLDGSDGSFSWARGLGGPDSDQAWAIAAAADGTFYATGAFSGDAQFGPHALGSAGAEDAYLTKFDASGNVLWAKSLGGSGNDAITSIAVDSQNQLYLTGRLQDMADLDPGLGVAAVTANGATDAFVLKLDGDGGYLRGWQMGGAACTTRGQRITVDTTGNIYVAGVFAGSGNVDFPAGSLPAVSPKKDGFALKFIEDPVVNEPPVAGDDSYLVNEDHTLTIVGLGVLRNDVDANLDSLTAISFTQPANGALVPSPDGSFTYTPALNFSGTDSFTYVASDGQSSSNVATVTITVTANVPPSAADDSYVIASHLTLEVAAPGVLGNDSDANNDLITAVSFTNPASGSLLPSADGSFKYTPNAGFAGTDSFTYRANDGQADSNVATVVITVKPSDAPIAKGDRYVVNANRALDVSAPGVLDNDSCAWGRTLTALKLTDPANGTLTLNPDGSFTYVSNPDFVGTDSFTYQANDGKADSDVATVTITVYPPATAGWVFDIGGSGEDWSNGIAVDADGNTCVVGGFRGTVDFDPGPGVAPLVGQGSLNGFLAKYSADGAFTWAQQAVGAVFGDLAVDHEGNVFVIGNFRETVAFGSLVLTSSGDFDFFVAKYLPDGTLDWVRQLGTGAPEIAAMDCAVDAVGDFYVTGMFYEWAQFGTETLLSAGSDDVFVTKLAGSDGQILWTTHAGGIVVDMPFDMVIGSDGSPYIQGMFYDTVHFGPHVLTSAEVAYDLFLARLDPSDGQFLWAQKFGGDDAVEVPLGIGADASGNVYISGMFDDAIAIGSYVLPLEGWRDVYVAKIQGDGTVVWATKLTGLGETYIFPFLTADPQGNTYLTGLLENAVDFDPGPGVALLTPVGDRDSFVLTLDADGNYVRVRPIGGDVTTIFGGPITVDSNGTVHLSGEVSGSGVVAFPNGNILGVHSAEDNIFVYKLVPQSQPNEPPIAGNDTYQEFQLGSLEVASPGVLANDTDANHDSLTAVLVSGPAHGTLVFAPDGSFTYTPESSFSGIDTFTYKVSDAETESNTATVSITIEPFLTINSVTLLETDGGTIDAVFTVTFHDSDPADVVFDYLTIDGTATAGADYQAASGQLVFQPGQTVRTIVIPILGDTLAEGDEDFFVRLSQSGGPVLAEGTGTILDNDQPVLVLPHFGLVTSESGGTAGFTVVLTRKPTADVTIGLSSSDSGEGLVSPSSLTFSPADWNLPQIVTVTGVDDGQADGDVAYMVLTAPATSSDPVFDAFDPADVSVTNSDRKGPGHVGTFLDAFIPTGSGGLAGPRQSVFGPDGNFYVASMDTNQILRYDGSTGAFLGVFASGGGLSGPADLTFGPDGDLYVASYNTNQVLRYYGVTGQFLEVFTVGGALADPTSLAFGPDGNLYVSNGADQSILRYDGSTGSCVDVFVQPGAGALNGLWDFTFGPAKGSLSLKEDLPEQALYVTSYHTNQVLRYDGTTGDFLDVFASGGGLTGPTGLAFGPDGHLYVADQAGSRVLRYHQATGTFTGAFVTAGSGGLLQPSGLLFGPDEKLYVNSLGNDAVLRYTGPPTTQITINDVSQYEGYSGTTFFSFTVSLSEPSSLPIAVSYATADGNAMAVDGDYVPADGKLTFNPGETHKMITVIVKADLDREPSEVFFVNLADPVNAVFGDAQGVGTILDDDLVIVAPTSGLVTGEDGTSDSFTVVLGSQPTADVTIGLSSSDPSEGTVSPASLTFTPADWDVPQTVTVTGVDDAEADGTVAYTIVLAPAVSLDPDYNGLDPIDVSVLNTDDDVPPVGVSPTTGLVTSEGGGTVQFTVVLAGPPTADVTIGLSSSDPSEGTVSPASLTFTPADWDVPQTVTVTGVDDAEADGDVAYTIVTAPALSLDPDYSGFDPVDVSVTNLDDETSVTDGLIGYWPLDGHGADFSSNGRDLDLFGGIGFASGVYGQALDLRNNGQQFARRPVDDEIYDFGSGDFTIQVWVNFNGTSGEQVLFEKFNGSGGPGWTLTKLGTNQWHFYATPSVMITTPVQTINSGVWHQVVVRKAGNDFELFYDATSVATRFDVDPIPNTNNPLLVGKRNEADTRIFPVNGRLDEIAIWDRALSTAEIISLYGSATPLRERPLAIAVSPTKGLVTSEDETGDPATFTVVLNRKPMADVTVALSSSDPGEGTVSPVSLTFTPADWDVPQTVTVTGIDDAEADGDVAYTIVTAPAVSLDPDYNGLDPLNVSVTNRDDDPFAEIRGTKWHDLDGDRVWDQPQEPGLAGWTIYVDLDGDGQFDPGQEPYDVTDSGGNYAITNLLSGTYTVAEVPQSGWQQTFPIGSDGGQLIDVFVPAGSGGLNRPRAFQFGPDGNLYVLSADTDQVLRYDGITGQFLDVFASGGGLERPWALVFGPDANLYVGDFDTRQVLRYDGITGDFIGVFSSMGGLDGPRDLVFGPDGNLYVLSGWGDLA